MSVAPNLLNAWQVAGEYKSGDPMDQLAFVFREKTEEVPVFVQRVPYCCGAIAVFSPKPLSLALRKSLYNLFLQTGDLVMFINIPIPKATVCGPIHVLAGRRNYHLHDFVRGNVRVDDSRLVKCGFHTASIKRTRKVFQVGDVNIIRWTENVYFMYYLYNLTKRNLQTIRKKIKPTDHLFGIRNDSQGNATHAFYQMGVESCFDTMNPSGNGSRLYLHWQRGLDTTTRNVKLKRVRSLKAR